MVAAPGRVRSPSSIRELLQNINSLPCHWRDNSPLAHHGSVTKREWISSSKPQRIEKGACTYTGIYRHEPQEEGVRITQQIHLLLLSRIFLFYPRYFVLTLASEALWQAPHWCITALILFFRIKIYEDDSILDDLIWLTIRASLVWHRLWGTIALRRIIVEHCSIQFNIPDGIHH